MARIKENHNFKNLGIYDPVILAIEDKGFIKATEVQKRAIPLVNNDENLIIAAPTGSGKTLIFASKIIEVTDNRQTIQSLVIVPTRELALQVEKDIKFFSKYKPLNINSITGGNSMKSQIKLLENSQVLIATPGRLAEHIREGNVNLSNVHLLVFDEMDAIIKNEFLEDIETIIKELPRKRQTLMFSATITKDEGKFAQKYMKRARRVLVDDKKSKQNLEQVFYIIPSNMKLSLLSYLLKNENSGLSLIFVNRKEVGDFIIKNLKHLKLKFGFIHKDLTQSKREKIINEFKNEKLDVLIATDIASRGLDVEGITHVYNYSIPNSQEKYIHRIGRTARAGAKGKVIDFISKNDEEKYLKILNEKKIPTFNKEIPQNLEEIKIKHEIKKRDFKKEKKKK